MIAQIAKQLRRVLVLCEDPEEDTIDESQFLAPSSMWSRIPKVASADGSRDFDDDNIVRAQSARAVQKLRLAWQELQPMKKMNNDSAAIYALVGNKGRGLPPS
eukprot:4495790-Pleurochrysis_carterae.AAC.1